ncbi:MAG: glycerol-3-phosphate 1-O-acyltransferase PlsY [Blautia sp.]|nr:glycerol-3-phosphate 1-O-acyltransferase PlsY [Blautia sp.]
MLVRLLCLGIGYLFGLIQTGYFIGKAHHEDIRERGSGNAGSTNALRVYGAKAGLLTLLGDVLKAIAAILLVSVVFGDKYGYMLPLLKMYTGAGVVLGHNFPFYLGFRGGKGVAASLGISIIFDWKLVVIIAIVFLGLVFLTRYVSLASLSAYTAVLTGIIVFGQMGFYNMEQRYLNELYILFVLMTALAYFRHRKNIVRLLNGTENKISIGSHGK